MLHYTIIFDVTFFLPAFRGSKHSLNYGVLASASQDKLGLCFVARQSFSTGRTQQLGSAPLGLSRTDPQSPIVRRGGGDSLGRRTTGQLINANDLGAATFCPTPHQTEK